MTPNPHKVPLKKWRKWSDTARRAFNDTYPFMRDNPGLVTHPKSPEQKAGHWNTICWNAAWLAADAADGTYHQPGDIVEVAPQRKRRAA